MKISSSLNESSHIDKWFISLMKSLFKFSWKQMWCRQPIPGETTRAKSRRNFHLSHPPITLSICRHPRNLLTPSQNACHQIQKRNGLGQETRWQAITNVLCAPSNPPLSVVPSFVLSSRGPPPDSPQVHFVPSLLLTLSTVLLPQIPCVLHSGILFYLLSHSLRLCSFNKAESTAPRQALSSPFAHPTTQCGTSTQSTGFLL